MPELLKQQLDVAFVTLWADLEIAQTEFRGKHPKCFQILKTPQIRQKDGETKRFTKRVPEDRGNRS